MPLPAPPALDPSIDWALFLDVDGTLLELASKPDAVEVPPSLVALLERISGALGGALALVSGRALADLDALFSPLRLPAVGIHGLEIRHADGSREAPTVPEGWKTTKAALTRFATSAAGLLLEDKGGALALHYRMAPTKEAAAKRLVQKWAATVGAGSTVQEGKMVVELRAGASDKGHGIRALSARAPFLGRTPVFLGDDLTDHAGFREVNDDGGLSIAVGDGPTGSACYALASVPDVHRWLTDLADQLRGSPPPNR